MRTLKFPGYKTQIEITRERLRRYHKLVGFGDSGTYEDINDEGLQEFFDEYSWPKPRYPRFPWWEILLFVALIIWLVVRTEILTK